MPRSRWRRRAGRRGTVIRGDGYGEHADGSPFDGRGTGRAWPLLTGERAHYELAAGRFQIANELARAMEQMAGENGLLPEQVWDGADIPGRELFSGHASGSASPLVWAHASTGRRWTAGKASISSCVSMLQRRYHRRRLLAKHRGTSRAMSSIDDPRS
jgi:hypothetical protein